MGEETIHTAKNHFKAADFRRIQTRWTIIGCFSLNVTSIIGISTVVDQWLAALGLLGTLFLFYWDAEEGKDYRFRHKEAGEAYLVLHKDIRRVFMQNEIKKEEFNLLHKQQQKLDKSGRPDVPWIARKWGQKSIEKYGETDNWWEVKGVHS